ncbi:RNA-binding S4 domain-containing protein [Colwelliaceae bacterium 6441]
MQGIPSIEVSYQPIELCKLLKIANLVSGGGEAKIVISEGYVLVNGEVEFQKRKKIYHSDIIEFNGETIAVHCLTPAVDVKTMKANKAAKKIQNSKQIKTKSKTKEKERTSQTAEHTAENKGKNSPISGKRKRISF